MNGENFKIKTEKAIKTTVREKRVAKKVTVCVWANNKKVTTLSFFQLCRSIDENCAGLCT